jgi:FkbM family methyltransferase
MSARPGNPSTRAYRGRINPGFFAHLFKAVFKQHHRELLPLLRPLISADAVVLDVGAHAGQYAKLFARLAPRGRVYAVEPQSYARRILRAALAVNRLGNVIILPVALGARRGKARLTIPVKASGSYGFGLAHLGPDQRGGPAETEEVDVETLDGLAQRLGLARLDFIKADIEGFEQAMIEGATLTLKRLKPALLIEFNQAHLARAGGSVASLWKMLKGLGYRPFDPGVGSAMAPISRPRQGDILWLHGERES